MEEEVRHNTSQHVDVDLMSLLIKMHKLTIWSSSYPFQNQLDKLLITVCNLASEPWPESQSASLPYSGVRPPGGHKSWK